VDDRATSAVSVGAVAFHLAAIHRADSESSLAARVAGLPLPPSEVVIYSTLGMTVESRFHVAGQALDLVLNPPGDRVYVLVPHEGSVYVHDLEGTLLETFHLTDQGGEHGAMLSGLAMAPDGSRLVVPITDAEESWLADIDLIGERDPADQILRQGLGHARRVQGLCWDDDGSGVYVSAVRGVVKFNRIGLPVAWKRFGVNYVDVQPIPGSDETVMVTPTFSSTRGSGGVSVIAADGTVLRSIELPDMSPFVVAVRP
jgi:sugar lactone lactonase YvrE